jgi:hypothetical protein
MVGGGSGHEEHSPIMAFSHRIGMAYVFIFFGMSSLSDIDEVGKDTQGRSVRCNNSDVHFGSGEGDAPECSTVCVMGIGLATSCIFYVVVLDLI